MVLLMSQCVLEMSEILYSLGRGYRKFQKGQSHWKLKYTFSSYIKKFHFPFYYFKVRVKFFSIFVVANQFEEGKQNALLSLLPTVFKEETLIA